MTEVNQGQVSESPTGVVAEPGQEQETETPAVDTTESIVKAASASEEPAASETDEKPAPYDQDPKWLAARAAEKSLQEILGDSDIEDVEALKVMLRNGMTLTEILGDRDAKQLIQDADTLKKYKEYWADQERLKEEEDLDPDELADKYKKELANVKKQQADKETEAGRVTAAKTAIENYNGRIGNIIEKQSFDEDTAEIAKMFLGVNNPFNDVDISDMKAVKDMATKGTERFTKFLDGVRQKAIDEYAAGKSKIIPITATETPRGPGVEKKTLPKDASVEEVFASAKDELFELISGGTSP